jgi:hypothetical protein
MGILDDAIREHLELKRRHGASEEELHQQEVEALGEPVAAEPEPLEEDLEAAEAAGGDGVGALPDEAEPEEEPEALDEPEPLDEPDHLGEPEAEAEPEATAEPEPLPEPELAEPEPELPPAEEPPALAGDTPPHGFAAVDEEDGDEEDVDVLEDTPDFLQETPEHDRLWFEQKPPRDFDFD